MVERQKQRNQSRAIVRDEFVHESGRCMGYGTDLTDADQPSGPHRTARDGHGTRVEKGFPFTAALRRNRNISDLL